MCKFYFLSGVLLLCLPAFIPSPLFAQVIVSESVLELAAGKDDKIAVEELQLNPNGSFTLYAFVQQPVTPSTCRPALQIYALDSLLKLRETKTIPYTLSEPEEQGGKIVGSSGWKGVRKPEDPYQKLLAAHPSFYQTRKQADNFYEAVRNQQGQALIRHIRQSYSYDSLSHSFFAHKKEQIFSMALGAFADRSLYIHDEIKINGEKGIVSMVVGELVQEDEQTVPYREQTILLSRLKGEVMGMYDLSFDYPMEVRLQQYVYDHNKKWKGVAYIFGPARRFGKWETDPDPTNYQLVVLDTLGAKILHHAFRYGGQDRASEPFFVSAMDEAFYFLGKGVGRKPDYHLFVFDSAGLKKQTLINPDELYEKTLGPYEKGLHNEYSSNFVPAGARHLPGGGFILYGEHRYTEAIAAGNPASNSFIPARFRYPAYVFLQFDKEGNFVHNYVVARQQEERPARMELLSATDEALQLLVHEPYAGKEELKGYQVFQTSDEKVTIYKNYQEEAETPLILSLHLQKKKTSVVRFTEGFVSIGEKGLFYYNPERKELLVAGKQLNHEGPLSIMLKKVRF